MSAASEMSLLILALLGGMLTIFSPCILPVIPLVFSRAGRSLSRDIAPVLAGLALAFTITALIAGATTHWLLVADVIGRDASLLLLGIVALSLLFDGVATWLARPVTRLGARLLGRVSSRRDVAGNVVIGVAVGLLWAPCAGPILGLLFAVGATAPAGHAALLYFTFAIGAVMSLAAFILLGDRLLARVRSTGPAERRTRRVLGLATLLTVVALSLGWDRALFAGRGVVGTASAEEALVRKLTSPGVRAQPGGQSLDDFAAEETARLASVSLPVLDGTMPSLDGGTAWINSPPLTAASLRGKVVLVDFWTFACYNCLNALPHVKDLYAKYRDRGFVVVGVHTPELAHERIPESVRQRVSALAIAYPVVIDNDMRIWRAYHNQYWPAAYFIDARGQLRFHHAGEGRYEEQDKVVAKLLAERDADLAAAREKK